MRSNWSVFSPLLTVQEGGKSLNLGFPQGQFMAGEDRGHAGCWWNLLFKPKRFRVFDVGKGFGNAPRTRILTSPFHPLRTPFRRLLPADLLTPSNMRSLNSQDVRLRSICTEERPFLYLTSPSFRP